MNRYQIRRSAAVLLALLTVICLSACGGGTPSSAAPETTAAPSKIDITTAPETTEAPTTAPETTAPETEATTEVPTTEEPTTAEETTTEEETEPETKPEPFGKEDLLLKVDGTDLTLRMDFVPVKDQLFGGVYDEQVGQACVGGGNDRSYYYDGGKVSIYTVGSASGAQTVYDIYIEKLEGYATAKGAVIGTSTWDEVIAIYGDPSTTSPAAQRYSLGDFDLIFGYDGDILSSITLHDNAVM